MDKSDPNALAKLFGVENMVTPKTLVTETKREVWRKTPNEAAQDIRVLLDEMNLRVVSRDIVGCCECLKAIQLRVDLMNHIANEIKRAQGL